MKGTDTANRLLKAVAAQPDDDLPRLKYAAFLREVGDPLGYFIAIQCDLARGSRGLYPFRPTDLFHSDDLHKWLRASADLRDRESRLWTANHQEWERPFKDAGAESVTYRRGFPHTINIAAAAFPSKARTLLRLAPTVREVVLTRPDYIDQPDKRLRECPVDLASTIAYTPQLAQIQALTLFGFGGWGDTAIREIIASPHLTSLRQLDLTAAAAGPGAIDAIFQASTLPNLEILVLGDTPQSLEVLHRIAQQPVRPARLHTLDLSDMELSDKGAASLASAPVLAGLKTLHLGNCGLTQKGFNALLRSDCLKNTVIDVPTQNLPVHARRAVESQLRQHNDRCTFFRER